MDIFNVLTLIGGLCLFLFGMNIMGESLERGAGSKLEVMIGKLTTGKLTGFLTGLGVTAIIQSSSATTVMVVGFVNSGLMSLKQAIHVIMGANVGTTVTAKENHTDIFLLGAFCKHIKADTDEGENGVKEVGLRSCNARLSPDIPPRLKTQAVTVVPTFAPIIT